MGKKIISDEKFAIETKRLHITPVTKDEASHYLREFDLEVTRFQYTKPFTSIESVKGFIADFEEARKDGRHLIASIYDKASHFVGSIEFYNLNMQQPSVNIWICKQEWRKGYAYEALRGMINFFYHQLNIKAFLCEADKRNEAGVALIKKYNAHEIERHEVIREDQCSLNMTKYLLCMNENGDNVKNSDFIEDCVDIS